MTDKPLKVGYTKTEFTKYVNTVVKKNMGVWRPRGLVLHNTFNPTLERVDGYINSKKWTMPQLVDNWWQTYVHAGWPSGPHLFIYRDKIYLGEPLWKPGTHSPSWNHTHWGMEMVGDYSKEKFPDDIMNNAVYAGATLFAMLGRPPDNNSFHFHGEDPNTTHKNCPGKNVGPKEQWLLHIKETMNSFNPGEHVPPPATPLR